LQWASYAYSDKARETKRLAAEPNSNQADNQHQSKKQRREQMKQNAAWSHKAEVKQNREVRKLKRERKKAWERAVHSQQIGSETTKDQEESAEKDWKDGARSKSQKIREGEADWEEFLEEERAAKKAKREKSKAKVIASTDIFLGL
jgi:ATP-dependent RNA helicase DDX55/SPB4